MNNKREYPKDLLKDEIKKDHLFDVKFKQDNLFVMFYKFSTGMDKKETPTKDGCSFTWIYFFSILLLPFTWWNILLDYLHDDRGNLFVRTFRGIAAYIVYLSFTMIGFGLFVYGESTNGKEFSTVIDLFNVESSSWLNIILLPLSALLFIGGIIALIGGLIYGIAYLFETIKHNYYLRKDRKYDEKQKRLLDSKEKKTSLIMNIFKLLVAFKKKMCVVIEWE